MASFSDYTENKVLDHMLRGTTFSIPNLYVALFTSSTGLENNTPASQTEVSSAASGYARVAVPSYTGFSAASSGQSTNAAAFEFPTATADWGTVTHIAFMDSETVGSGNVIWWSTVTNPRTVYNGDLIRFAAGSVVLSID